MQTQLDSVFLSSSAGAEADRILRACVHCGFCTATCPTYLLTGNELDSPRGRIYLLKSALEKQRVSELTRHHLDRCLSCQSCETTCPSDVNYHRLYAIGKEEMATQVRPALGRTLKIRLLRFIMEVPRRFRIFLSLGRAFRFLLPSSLAQHIPRADRNKAMLRWPTPQHERRMILLNGCVQGALSPATNAAAARVLDRLGISAQPLADEGCCGAIAFHGDAFEEGRALARQQLDRLCAELDSGIEQIISSASGCGNFMTGYASLFADEADYLAKAQRVAAHLSDLAAVIDREPVETLALNSGSKMAFHCPCTLQHGLQGRAGTEALLQRLGFRLSAIADSHLCCGSAGLYSLLQPKLADALRKNKLAAITAGQPDIIATANIGCQQHLAATAGQPVRHWIEYVDEALAD